MLDMLKKAVPIPALSDHQRIVFVGPHPDDIEVGAGGLVAQLVHAKKQVFFVIVTDGGSGSFDPTLSVEFLAETRSQETIKAASFLGVEEIFQLGFPDGGIYSVEEVASKIARILLETNPDLVVCPDPLLPSETHLDHILTGLAVNRAVLIANYPNMARRNHVLFDEGHIPHFHGRTLGYYYTHRVNQVIRLNELEVLQKIKAIQIHESQFSNAPDFERLAMYLDVRSKFLLKTENNGSAEGYFVYGSTHQHCFPEINFY